LWNLKLRTEPAQVPHESEPMWGMDIINVDMPSGEAAEKSSSYNLSIFSFGADSKGAKVVTAMRKDSSPSVGALWPDIDKLDNPSNIDTSIVRACNASIHGKSLAVPIENTNKRSRHEGDMDSLTNIAGTSNFR
jgi:hypothetical protein